MWITKKVALQVEAAKQITMGWTELILGQLHLCFLVLIFPNIRSVCHVEYVLFFHMLN
jgi:hypothetical protein